MMTTVMKANECAAQDSSLTFDIFPFYAKSLEVAITVELCGHGIVFIGPHVVTQQAGQPDDAKEHFVRLWVIK